MKLALCALAAAAGLVTPAAGAPSWSWKALHRPLHVPRIDPGSTCPVSAASSVDLGAEGVRMLPGRGPAYPNFGGGGSVLEFFWPALPTQVDFYGSGWSGNKVLWWVAGTYHGPVLIRGHQADGTDLVRFDRGKPPAAEIRIAPGAGYAPWKGARDRPSFTRVRRPGCYAYQIDGTTFSRVIVFEARVVPPPS